MHRITFVVDLFKGPEEMPVSHAALKAMLVALTMIDVAELKANPALPNLYESGVRYEEEPQGQEDWQDILTCLRLKIADCLPVSTLVLRDDYTFAPLGSLVPGDRIMGDGNFTTVLDHAITGEKTILAFDLDNGCTLRCSPEHRVFLDDGAEVRAEDVRVGQRLKGPSQAFAPHAPWKPDTRLSDVDAAWLTGTYIADGWHDRNGSRFSISGDDEKPKRRKVEQKDRVASLMSALGVHARRAKKYVEVHDRPLTAIMAAAGAVAPDKKVPDMRLSLEQAKAMIEGLQTDCSTSNTGTMTHGTVSPTLALQLRVLYRMLDQSVHIRRWDDHGGLGSNPVYRVGVRRPADEDWIPAWKTRAEQYRISVRIRAVREEAPELCADIATDTGRFYLPESDTIVHNCEDLSAWRAAELQVRHGIMAWPTFNYRVRPEGGFLYHIQVRHPDGRIEDPSRALGMR